MILAGLGFGGATLFYTVSELLATSPEQKVYNKALAEVRADGQVSVYLVSSKMEYSKFMDVFLQRFALIEVTTLAGIC